MSFPMNGIKNAKSDIDKIDLNKLVLVHYEGFY